MPSSKEMVVCYRCHKYVETEYFHHTPDDPLAAVCDGCKKQLANERNIYIRTLVADCLDGVKYQMSKSSRLLGLDSTELFDSLESGLSDELTTIIGGIVSANTRLA